MFQFVFQGEQLSRPANCSTDVLFKFNGLGGASATSG